MKEISSSTLIAEVPRKAEIGRGRSPAKKLRLVGDRSTNLFVDYFFNLLICIFDASFKNNCVVPYKDSGRIGPNIKNRI